MPAQAVGNLAEHMSTAIGAVMSTRSPGIGRPEPGTDGQPAGGLVLRLLLGAQLRRFREAADITPDRAGYEIRASRSKISRIETGNVGFKTRDINDLLTLYGVTDDEERSRILAIAEQASQPDWWDRYSDVLPGWFENYLALESVAAAIRSFEIQFVPGLVQTEVYATAVTELGHQASSAGEIERRVGLRLKRQQLLTRAAPPRIWSVIDEAVLRRPIGGRAVLRAQLEHLIEAAAMPQVTLQVVPFSRGGHAGASGSFTILRFTEQDLLDVVYVEQLTSALYLEQRADVEHYLEVMDQLSTEALTPADTVGFIEQIAKET